MHPYINLTFAKLEVFPLCLVFAIFACLFIFLKSQKYDLFYFPRLQKSIIFVIVFSGLGGKGLFLLTQISKTNIQFIELFGGFVFYGGFIGALIGLFVYCRVYHERFLDLADVFTSLLPLGQSIGRIGCYFNGCCYGREYNGFLAVRYIVDGTYVTVFPTWFIESAFCLLMFIFFLCNIQEKEKRILYSDIYAHISMLSAGDRIFQRR